MIEAFFASHIHGPKTTEKTLIKPKTKVKTRSIEQESGEGAEEKMKGKKRR